MYYNLSLTFVVEGHSQYVHEFDVIMNSKISEALV